jgi:hypothetical protein
MFGLIYPTRPTAPVTWYGCRDVLRRAWKSKATKDRKQFYFLLHGQASSYELKFKQLVKMLTALQDKMGLTKRQRITVERTEIVNCALIKTSAFWRVRHRFDFLSAFLRNCSTGTKKSYKKIIEGGQYFKQTQPAVKRFIEGSNKLTSKTREYYGWVNTFSGKSDKDVKTLLK